LILPKKIPKNWIVDCTKAGKGISALKYLSRYLYRGVISENNIVANDNGHITFKYIDGDTGKTKYRRIKGEDFLQLVVQHTLPSGSGESAIMDSFMGDRDRFK
jgi:hypothetical protein